MRRTGRTRRPRARARRTRRSGCGAWPTAARPSGDAAAWRRRCSPPPPHTHTRTRPARDAALCVLPWATEQGQESSVPGSEGVLSCRCVPAHRMWPRTPPCRAGASCPSIASVARPCPVRAAAVLVPPRRGAPCGVCPPCRVCLPCRARAGGVPSPAWAPRFCSAAWPAAAIDRLARRQARRVQPGLGLERQARAVPRRHHDPGHGRRRQCGQRAAVGGRRHLR